jgi:hypothetical protein
MFITKIIELVLFMGGAALIMYLIYAMFEKFTKLFK